MNSTIKQMISNKWGINNSSHKDMFNISSYPSYPPYPPSNIQSRGQHDKHSIAVYIEQGDKMYPSYKEQEYKMYPSFWAQAGSAEAQAWNASIILPTNWLVKGQAGAALLKLARRK